MNPRDVDAILERIFLEAEVEDESPNPRFRWQPPPSGARKPKKTLSTSAAAHMDNALKASPENLRDPEDRIGKYSSDDLVPPDEVATQDDLIDFFSRMQAAKGRDRESMRKEFSAHRTEFESKIREFVDALLS